jgi:uncharacterized membrane protein YeiH
MRTDAEKLLFTLDMAATLVFALQGAMAGIEGNLDLLGVMVLAFATALGGGLIRDLLIGAVPPASLRDWRYSAVALAGGAIVFCLYGFIRKIPAPLIMVLDAVGLSLFAVAGTEKALMFGMHPFIAVLMGTITGVGGGTVRDILLTQVPRVLRADVYATAALAGAICMVVGRKLRLPPVWAALFGGAVCFLLRVISVWEHWNLPKILVP